MPKVIWRPKSLKRKSSTSRTLKILKTPLACSHPLLAILASPIFANIDVLARIMKKHPF
jgi:hypothetical protein